MSTQRVVNRLDRAARSKETIAEQLQRRADQYRREAQSMRELQRVLTERTDGKKTSA